jgi:hypothetical protein
LTAALDLNAVISLGLKFGGEPLTGADLDCGSSDRTHGEKEISTHQGTISITFVVSAFCGAFLTGTGEEETCVVSCDCCCEVVRGEGGERMEAETVVG